VFLAPLKKCLLPTLIAGFLLKQRNMGICFNLYFDSLVSKKIQKRCKFFDMFNPDGNFRLIIEEFFSIY